MNTARCEQLSHFLNTVYATRNRAFHTIHHAIEVADGGSPIGQLAALFHDVVYIQVDHSRLPELRKHFGIFDPKDSFELVIGSTIQSSKWAKSLCALFGLNPGDRVSITASINEFLSAWVCIQCLQDQLTEQQLLDVCLAIRCTVPFQAARTHPTFLEEIENQYHSACQALKLRPTAQQKKAALETAIQTSNQDVRGFGLQEPEMFIYNSWALLFENNPTLQRPNFLISGYREPLQKLERFFSFLEPEAIFLRNADYPSPEHYQRLVEGAHRNLRIGREYIKVKLLETVIIEAFAALTGGDCALELFMGPKPTRREVKVARIETFLDPNRFPRSMHGKDEKVLRLLAEGRAHRSRFDSKTSAFGAFLYTTLTAQELTAAYAKAEQFAEGKCTPEDLLRQLPENHLAYIAEVLSQVALTRQKALLELAKKIRGSRAA